MSLDVEPSVAHAYTTPGQYIEVKSDAGDGYFVLASDVRQRPWQVLVKNAAGAAEVLSTLPIASALTIEGPLGNGFPVERMKDRHVVVAVVASALGVARAVVDHRIAEGAAEATHVLVGLRRLSDLPIEREVRTWTERGVGVVLCLSGGELERDVQVLPKARRVVGWVQHALARALQAAEVPHGTLVVAAGPDAMLADLRALGESATFPAGPHVEVLTNV